MGGRKQLVIRAATGLGCFPIGLAVQRVLFGARHTRVLNYHHTPDAAGFERQLQFYARHFTPGRPEDLEACIQGQARPPSPYLVVTFDDGYRSNYDIAAPLLEKYGFRGYFFLPQAYIASDRAAAEAEFAVAGPQEPEPRMTWDEARDLARRGHRIGCHSRTHVRLGDDLTPSQVVDEITQSGLDIAREMGAAIDDFCWVGGEEWSYGSAAYAEIRRAGYKHAFMTNLLPVTPGSSPLWIQRTNIESDWPLDQVRFYLSGVMDLAYAPKRRRLARKLLQAA